MFVKNLHYVFAVTALAIMTLSLPQVGDAMYGLFSSAPETALVAAANTTSAISVSEFKAKMGYNKEHQETKLSLTAKVKVTATGSSLTFSNESFGFTLFNKTLNRHGGDGRSTLVSASKLKKNADGTYTLKKNSSETFNVVMEYAPQSLIAGQYYATLSGIVTPEGKMTTPNTKSSTVTVVGEATPYITLASKSDLFGLKDTVAVNAVRLGKEIRVTIGDLGFINQNGDGYSKTFTLKLKEKTTQFKFNLGDYGIPAGDYYMFVENTSSGAVPGKSNNVHIGILNQDKLIVAKVTPGKLALAYDGNKEESALTAPFEVSIKAGANDLVFGKESFSVAAHRNNTGDASYGIADIEKIDGKVPATLPYTLKAGKTAVFSVKASFNPKLMFAGSYSSSLWWVAATRGGTQKELIQIPKNETNSVVIVGETSPFISGVTNPAEAGKSFKITGERLFGVSILIDGASLAGVSRTEAPDGTSVEFILPATLTSGFHLISVKSDATGGSNTVYFDVGGGTVTVCPAGFICYPTDQPIPVCPEGYICVVPVPDCPVGYNCVLSEPRSAATLSTNLISTNTSVTAGSSANDDIGVFAIQYRVTAVGGDVYIASSSVPVWIDRAGITLTPSTRISSALVNNTDSTLTSRGNFMISEGSSETFTLTTSLSLGGELTAGQYRASLAGIRWGISDVDTSAIFTSGLETYKTNYVILN